MSVRGATVVAIGLAAAACSVGLGGTPGLGTARASGSPSASAESSRAAAPLNSFAPARNYTAVGIGEREFSITAYRREVPAGEVRFNVANLGEDTHNLEVRGPGGFRSSASADIRSGARTTLAVRLARPGAYRLLCTKASHHRVGMTARLVVRPRR